MPALRPRVPDRESGAEAAREAAALRLPELSARAKPTRTRSTRPRPPKPRRRRAASGKCTTCCSSISARSTTPIWCNTREAVGLDERRFTDALASHEFTARVRHDFIGGVRSGVNGTPTFFINGVRYDDSWDFATLVSAVRAAIEAA